MPFLLQFTLLLPVYGELTLELRSVGIDTKLRSIGIERETPKFLKTRAKPVLSKTSRYPSDTRDSHAKHLSKLEILDSLAGFLFSLPSFCGPRLRAAVISSCSRSGATWYNLLSNISLAQAVTYFNTTTVAPAPPWACAASSIWLMLG